MVDDADELFQQLVADYGGASALTTVQISICRSLAQLLASDMPDGRVVASLQSLLPAKSAERSPYDLRNLDDDELELFDCLARRATGERAAALPVNALLMSTRRDFTIRELLALEMAQLLDRIELRDKVPIVEAAGATDQERLDNAIEHSSGTVRRILPGPTPMSASSFQIC